jgi:hypothetical protein
VFAPEVIFNYSEKELCSLICSIEEEIRLTPEQMNSAFHKSWKKIQEASIEQLVLEHLVHYFTTYGFESLGVYEADSVYIPSERLDIPEIDLEHISLVLIHGYTKEDIKTKLLKVLQSGIALSDNTIKDIVDVAKYVGITQEDVQETKNKEVKIALCEHLEMFPEEPAEFLRYVLYKITGRTLLIKDVSTIEALKTAEDLSAAFHLFQTYQSTYGIQRLAEIFYRFKPLFLALRSDPSFRSMINRIRKLAPKYHKPMRGDYLNEVTARIQAAQGIDGSLLRECLEKANPFRKIRLAYALQYRTQDVDSILYKIRNGKGYATDFSFEGKHVAQNVLDIVLRSLAEDVKKNVKGKKIYIPPYMKYALPATEKQFTGQFPSGTCVVVPKDMIMGIHWKNVDGARIDLDLSLMNPYDGKIGWDASYRTEKRTILFSGDMTDASGRHGASELFYVKQQREQAYIMFVNYFNYNRDIEVPFDILLAQEQAENFQANYMVNPSNVIARASSTIAVKQKILGLVITTTTECRFYFSEVSLGRSITSTQNPYVEHSRKYLVEFYQNAISLNTLLRQAGAIITEEQDGCDIDLSPGGLEKDSIIKLLAT